MKKFLDLTLVILFFACLASNFLPAQVHQALGLIFYRANRRSQRLEPKFLPRRLQLAQNF